MHESSSQEQSGKPLEKGKAESLPEGHVPPPKPPNPPAFPRPHSEYSDHIADYPQPSQSGMSLRDYFAAAVIGPLMASDGFEKAVMARLDSSAVEDVLPEFTAHVAYQIADAMLKERVK